MRARFVSYLMICLAGFVLGQPNAALADRSFQSWRASCDDTACSIQTTAAGARVYLRITRANAPNAPWHVSLTGLDGKIDPASPLGIWMNGAPVSRLVPKTGYRRVGPAHFIADEAALIQLFPGLAKGNRLAVSYMHWRGGRRTLTFSLSGLAPSLRWIDEQQKRSNREHYVAAPGSTGRKVLPVIMTQPVLAQTVAAPIITTGSIAPRSITPPALAAPAATPRAAGPPGSAPPMVAARASVARGDAAQSAADPSPESEAGETFGLPGPVLQALRIDKQCDLDKSDPPTFQESMVEDQLDNNRTLYLLACSSGAYNMVYRIYVYDRRYPEEAAPELFAAYSSSRGWYGKRSLINADYDPKTRTISAFEKGRGLGDCGSLERYKWTADGLRLVSYRYWGRCNGSRMPRDWPEIYRYGANKKRWRSGQIHGIFFEKIVHFMWKSCEKVREFPDSNGFRQRTMMG